MLTMSSATRLGEREQYTPLWKRVWEFLIRLNIGLLHNPAIPILGIYPERKKTIHRHKDLRENAHHCSGVSVQWGITRWSEGTSGCSRLADQHVPGGERTQCVWGTAWLGQREWGGTRRLGGGRAPDASRLGEHASRPGFVLRAARAVQLTNSIRSAFLKDSWWLERE